MLISSAEPAPRQDEEAIAKMIAEAKKFTEPGEIHRELARMIGEWDVEASLFMGPQAMPQGKGSSTIGWKVDGRFIEGTYSGALMGTQGTTSFWMGYDNMKKSFVYTRIGSFDTAMTHAQGDMTRDGKSLLMYGTLDEYTTGEHDKMVKYAWRFLSADKFVLEVHDLAIGEEHTKVLEFTYTRKE